MDMVYVYIYACLLKNFFTHFGIVIDGFHLDRGAPKLHNINCVYFEQIIIKSTQFGQFFFFFFF